TIRRESAPAARQGGVTPLSDKRAATGAPGSSWHMPSQSEPKGLLGAGLQLVDHAPWPAVRALRNPPHAFAWHHERAHPAFRGTIELRVNVAALGFGALDQHSQRHAGWPAALGVGVGEDVADGGIESDAIRLLQHAKINILEGG